tara:strand:+ start:17759 stop:18172 length:414 start_codon:yes stop_codon:yes gene_type:complete
MGFQTFTANSWDLDTYMPETVNSNNIYKKLSQILPEHLTNDYENKRCPICLEHYENSTVIVGQCCHAIHKNCFSTYVQESNELFTDYLKNYLVFGKKLPLVQNLNNKTLYKINNKFPSYCPICRQRFIIREIYNIKH